MRKVLPPTPDMDTQVHYQIRLHFSQHTVLSIEASTFSDESLGQDDRPPNINPEGQPQLRTFFSGVFITRRV